MISYRNLMENTEAEIQHKLHVRSHMTEDGIQIKTQRVKIMNKICIATEDMGQALKCLVTV